jgi:hypothetical protein
MQELARRSQDRQASIMIWCTILITVMTVIIVTMTAVSTYRLLYP